MPLSTCNLDTVRTGKLLTLSGPDAAVTGLYIATKYRNSAVFVDSWANAFPPPAVESAIISQRPGPPSPASPNSKSLGGCPDVSLLNVTICARAASPFDSHAAAANIHIKRLVSL